MEPPLLRHTLLFCDFNDAQTVAIEADIIFDTNGIAVGKYPGGTFVFGLIKL